MVLAFFCSVPDLIVSHFNYILSDYYALTALAAAILAQVKELEVDNRSLIKVNAELKKDNKSLKNIVDSIRLQIAKDMKGILKNQDSDLRQAILKLFKSTQG